MSKKLQIIYFSHGGGPMPLLKDVSHLAMIEFMQKLPGLIHKPEAIVVISAHWEEKNPTLLSNPTPTMLYDYIGFPEETYKIQYPAKGNPTLAEKIQSLLKKNDIEALLDKNRGFDHGLFIPLMLMYPEADIPAIQLSLVKGLDARKHIEIGHALRSLENKNILIIGSGFSFHNMAAFSWRDKDIDDPKNDAFQEWLIETCTKTSSQTDREELLENWENAPNARYCHPREEHLLPLHVCQAMAVDKAELIFDDYIVGKRSIAFLWK